MKDLQWISVRRVLRESADTSSLMVKPDHLVVTGNLPHCARISFDAANRQLLRRWLDAQDEARAP